MTHGAWPLQRELLERKERFKVIVAHRRFGKTMLSQTAITPPTKPPTTRSRICHQGISASNRDVDHLALLASNLPGAAQQR